MFAYMVDGESETRGEHNPSRVVNAIRELAHHKQYGSWLRAFFANRWRCGAAELFLKVTSVTFEFRNCYNCQLILIDGVAC